MEDTKYKLVAISPEELEAFNVKYKEFMDSSEAILLPGVFIDENGAIKSKIVVYKKEIDTTSSTPEPEILSEASGTK